MSAAIGDLLTIVKRSRTEALLFTEFGAVAGRLTEALVYSLNMEVNNKAPGTFSSGIESLRERTTKKGRLKDAHISTWFNSYLHTLRTLRNECSHAQSDDQRERQFPMHLDSDDVLLLATALRRVLIMHGQWRSKSSHWAPSR